MIETALSRKSFIPLPVTIPEDLRENIWNDLPEENWYI